MDIPTPVEFVVYIFGKMSSKRRTEIDPHFRPQWVMGPFCYMNIDIVAKVEDYEKDSNYILRNLNLMVIITSLDVKKSHYDMSYSFQDVLNIQLRSNSQDKTKKTDDPIKREVDFFSKLPKETIQKLFHFYEEDFELFGYSNYEKYLELGTGE